MSSNEITDKLRAFLNCHVPLTEECHAVYLMVELRKIIDQQRLKLPLLKFYSDWTVHSSKDRISPEIRNVSEALFSEALTRIGLTGPTGAGANSRSAFEAFENMHELRREMGAILGHIGIDPALLIVSKHWKSFVALLTEVLANQPIVHPSSNVLRIHFEASAGGCIVQFKHPTGAHAATFRSRQSASPGNP